ncbi:DUF5134 domain-containing protein [Streptomyces gobiensis]|uniref:DUF5134 domain-containing protein n=1 Tax=Streptomyces gobiensis TaxID=2875706 RepID=UPI0030D4ECD6
MAGTYCLLRTRRETPRQRQASGVEALMGFGMATMAVPSSAVAPPPPLLFAVVFAVAALWSLTLLCSGAPHQLHHLVEALAMIYMAGTMAAAPTAPHSGHSPAAGGIPLLTGALLVYFAAYTLCCSVRLLPTTVRTPAPVAGPAGVLRQPEVATAGRLALALGMFAMLITL